MPGRVAVDADELGGALAAVEVGGREQRAAAVRALQPMAGADGDARGVVRRVAQVVERAKARDDGGDVAGKARRGADEEVGVLPWQRYRDARRGAASPRLLGARMKPMAVPDVVPDTAPMAKAHGEVLGRSGVKLVRPVKSAVRL